MKMKIAVFYKTYALVIGIGWANLETKNSQSRVEDTLLDTALKPKHMPGLTQIMIGGAETVDDAVNHYNRTRKLHSYS